MMKDFETWFEELTMLHLEYLLPAPTPLAFTYEYDLGLSPPETFLAEYPEFNHGD